MLIDRIFPAVIAEKSTLRERLAAAAAAMGLTNNQVGAVLAIVPERLVGAGCFLDKMTGLWRYEFGVPYEIGKDLVWGTHIWVPVDCLLSALLCAYSRLPEEKRTGCHERVLALTKMHGSRRRMQHRLSHVASLRGQFDSVTVDSFAWGILRRWRSLSRKRSGVEPEANDYDEVCRRAGALLADGTVGRWVARTFPIVVVDEMQDSKDGQLVVLQAIAKSATCLAAADDYQDLDGTEDNAAVEWARKHGEVVTLTHNHRTSATGLLNAAKALRDGERVPENGTGFIALGAHNHNTGASHVSRNLTWWRGCNDIAIITPVRGQNSPFVRDLIHRVEQGPIGHEQFGPHRIPWEVSQEEEQSRFLAQLSLPQDLSTEIHASDISLPTQGGPSAAIATWLERQRRVAGRTVFTVAEVQDLVRLIYQRSRAYRRISGSGVRAMTIHQAKNRDFDSVIVLWPYEVQGSPERQRRLLYNAITRAKRRAVVVVQNPDRLNQPPFVL